MNLTLFVDDDTSYYPLGNHNISHLRKKKIIERKCFRKGILVPSKGGEGHWFVMTPCFHPLWNLLFLGKTSAEWEDIPSCQQIRQASHDLWSFEWKMVCLNIWFPKKHSSVVSHEPTISRSFNRVWLTFETPNPGLFVILCITCSLLHPQVFPFLTSVSTKVSTNCTLRIMGSQVTGGLEIQKNPATKTRSNSIRSIRIIRGSNDSEGI